MKSTTSIILLLIASSAISQLVNPVKTGCKTDKFVDVDKAGCQECEAEHAKYFFEKGANENYYRCAKCGENCLNCETKAKTDGSKEQEAAKCTQCKDGHGADTTADSIKCKACEKSNCQNCNGDYKKCTQCKSGFSFDTSGECSQCSVADCATCNAKGQCVLCKEGKALDGISCVSTCKQGDTIFNGRCVSCPSQCLSCQEPEVCTKCKDGFHLTSASQCQACSSNCSACYSNGKCQNCINDTVLLSDGTCGSEPWYKKWWVWLLIGLLALAIFGALGWFLSMRSRTFKPTYNADTQLMNASYNNGYAPRAGVNVGQPILGQSYASGRGYY